MVDEKKSSIVLGEASESDEDDYMSSSKDDVKNLNEIRKIKKTVVSGEASESDNESDDNFNITAEAFRSKAEEVQYNTLLHKKLRESNARLKEDMKDLVMNSFKFAIDQVNDINQRLITNQIEIQETIKNLRKSSVSSEKLSIVMSSLLAQNYLPSININ